MSVIWDERLITRSRAADMCGTWELTMDYQESATFLRCAACDGNITRLPSDGMILTADVLIAAVVRHMAMNHNYNLSGVSNEDNASVGAAADDPGSRHRGRRTGDPVRGSGHKEISSLRGNAIAGGA